jgi:hypothetical protein
MSLTELDELHTPILSGKLYVCVPTIGDSSYERTTHSTPTIHFSSHPPLPI